MYFDNNACVPPTDNILRKFCTGAKLGNILSGGPNAEIGKSAVNQLASILTEMFGQAAIVFNSGGSEGNSTILRSFAGAHIVCSTVEHSSITEIAKTMNTTWVKPTATGHIQIKDILASVRPNTALVVLQSVNSETGAVQPISELLTKLDKHIAVHIDHVQGFMKYPQPIKFDPRRKMSMTVSFHKIGSPIGFGMLATNYRFSPLIGGTHNDGLRGGTMNIGGVYGTLQAMSDFNYQKTIGLREHFNKMLDKHFMVLTYPKFMEMIDGGLTGKYVVLVSHSGCLPHTIFMCIGRDSSIYCNKLIKDELNKNGIIIGIGSACNTNKKEGDTIGSMKSAPIPTVVQNGFLRISLSCYNTKSEVTQLVKILASVS